MKADRRQFLRNGLWAMATLMGSPGLLAAAREERARSLPAGVHLFLDSELIAEERNLRRVIHPPTRLPEPIVTTAADRCFQPYVSVLRDPGTKRFRMWYNATDRRHADPHRPTWSRRTASASSGRIASLRTRAASRSDSVPTSS